MTEGGGRVAGKVVLITGGASGLGAEDARALSREGATVVITDVQDAMGRDVAGSIANCIYLNQDVRDEARWLAVTAEVTERFGRLDGLINNAGIVRFADVAACSLKDFRDQIEIMVDGTFLGCKAAIPHMAKSGGGSIVNLASTAGLKGMSAIPAYAAAKGGIVAMTRSIAKYCQEQGNGIRVNSIAPGSHDTPMTQEAFKLLAKDDAAIAHAAAQGQGKPEDVANLILFLVSEESRNITGSCMVIDGGETM